MLATWHPGCWKSPECILLTDNGEIALGREAHILEGSGDPSPLQTRLDSGLGGNRIGKPKRDGSN